MTNHQELLRNILRQVPGLGQVLRAARDIDLPDWMIFSGAVYQPVWNALSEFPLEHGLNDYDLGYFDDRDLSWNAEDAVIRRVATAMPAGLRGKVEVRNQARVHFWFEDHFGEPYAPLRSSAEALTRFTATAFAVGVRLQKGEHLQIFAPFGLDDLFAMRLRPTTDPPALGFAATANKAIAKWPRLMMESAQSFLPPTL